LVLGVKDNFTRFYILASRPSSPLPNTQDERTKERNALVRLEVLPRTEPQDAPVTVADLLAALRLPVVRVDRRPSTSVPRERFGSVYFVEVMDNKRSDDRPRSPPPQQQPQRHAGQVEITGTDVSLWKEMVLGAIARVVERGGRADLLGTW
jgi:prephenate dehydratase